MGGAGGGKYSAYLDIAKIIVKDSNSLAVLYQQLIVVGISTFVGSYTLFLRTSKFWLSLGLFLIFSIHLLKILAKSQPQLMFSLSLFLIKKECT